jgi:hypothetical protein
MVYVPATERIIGHWYEQGMVHWVGHDRHGNGLTKTPSALFGTLLADDSGYAELSPDGVTRYTASGEKFETYDTGADRFGDSEFAIAAARPVSDTAGRYAILGGYKGGLRWFSLGCK